jgi:drug/metabolite transporter (DMT)-like permease
VSATTALPVHRHVHHVPLAASLLAVGAGTTWSFGALCARLADGADAWQYLIWRSVGIIVVIEAMARLRHRRSPTTVSFTSGRLMLLANSALLLASVAYVYAVKTTTAANAAFLSSITPLLAVVMARVVLHERLTRITVAAIALAFVGLAVMVSADIGAGSMRGNVSALFSSVGFAGYTICVRSDQERDWSPVLPGYGVMMIALCGTVTLANGNPLVPRWHDVAWALFHGAVLIVVGTLAFNAAARKVPAVAMTVFAQSETVFAPFWVFLALSERPGARTLLGAALILAAVIGKAVLDSRPARAPDPASVPV